MWYVSPGVGDPYRDNLTLIQEKLNESIMVMNKSLQV